VTKVIETTEVVMVPFRGQGSGSAGLTWGQQHIWNAMQALGSPMNMCATRELSPGARIEEFTDELQFYVNRYQSLRTLLQLVPGDWPRQIVVESGEIALDIADVPPDQDPARVAADLARWYEDAEFDVERDFPIKMTLLRRDGALTHLVMTISHFATDAVGAMAMYTAYIGRDQLPHGAPPPGLQPLELVARQQLPAALRQSEASLRYWEGLLRTIPMRRFPDPVDPGIGRYCQVRMDSPAMLLALRSIGARLAVDVGTALLGVVAVGIARVAGINPVVAQMVVSNRFRPGFCDIVSNVAQAGLLVVDVADVTVDEAVTRARHASINAYKHAYFDFTRWKELVARVDRERGGEVDLKCYYNDRPSQYRSEGADSPPSREQIEAALPGTSALRWSDLPYFNEHLMVTIDDVPGAIGLIVLADTAYVPRPRMQELALELESLAVEVAREPKTMTGVGG
jgi:condensation domain-containing protein